MLRQLRVEGRISEGEALGHGNIPEDERSARQVERDVDESLVDGVAAAGETPDTSLVAERLPNRLAEGDADVLDGVMGVDREVALRPDGQVEAAVAPHLVEHVIEERNSG